jgi:hypothetical protein
VGATFDPITLEEVERWRAGPSSVFSNSTMALEVGAEIWFGTFSGTRIGIISPLARLEITSHAGRPLTLK